MCGIAAILKRREVKWDAESLSRMVGLVAHRGPDDSSTAFFNGVRPLRVPDSAEKEWTIGLGHRRLSILDLSELGRQPMCHQDRYWIVFNGEVYNYLELRNELSNKGYRFRSGTDTEVVLASFAEWREDCFSRFRGMWGMVIVDLESREMFLSRDRMGIKPLYLLSSSSTIAIASEIKQFTTLDGFKPRVDRLAAQEFLFSGYEDPERTFFADVKPVPAGCFQRLCLDTLFLSSPESFWEPEAIEAEVHCGIEAAEMMRETILESMALHRRSDVTVGSALSGGLDSSILTILLNRGKSEEQRTHTFTVTFPGESIDERRFSEMVVKMIEAEGHFVGLSAGRFLEEWDHFVWMHDEPVGSLSVYAGYSVARAMREAGVPVTLNGQGGDEVFSGYWQSYFVHLRNLARSFQWGQLLHHVGGAIMPGGNPLLLAQVPDMYRRLRSRMAGRDEEGNAASRRIENFLSLSPQLQRIYQIRTLFLPRLLKWDDRNSMSFSVEGRYPFLDHKVIELGLSFQPEVLYSRGWTKWPLRNAFRQCLPKGIVCRRSKFGFETPQLAWMVGPLKPSIEAWLGDESPVWEFVRREVLVEKFAALLDGRGSEESVNEIFRGFAFHSWARVFRLSL